MGKDSKIEWTEHTINPWWGCSKVHTGCKNCYAEYLSETRYSNNVWGENNPRKPIKSAWNNLLKWQKQAYQDGKVVRVFCSSMGDIFEDKDLTFAFQGATNTGQLRDRLFKEINEGFYPNLVFLLLTKRPSNIPKMIPKEWKMVWPANVWVGTSIADQKTANKYIGQFLQATYSLSRENLFLSVEPQVGEISLIEALDKAKMVDEPDKMKEHDFNDHVRYAINWVIQGGESGNNRRPFDLKWGYKLKEECKQLGMPYFFKQIDKVRDHKEGIPEALKVRELPDFEARVLKRRLITISNGLNFLSLCEKPTEARQDIEEKAQQVMKRLAELTDIPYEQYYSQWVNDTRYADKV